ncbi:MAG: chitobiase/beta-hexosaminidase C-terminal domain-containing protein, partial [Bacteroidales bacterium]|nr:chitobiase/beta-hexosaminidase C-terminal domain-containing protein [Bacteroidales bacterium]
MKAFFVRYLMILALLFGAGGAAWAQAVIMNGDNYLTHNEAGATVNATATTTFNPATCLWAYASRDYIRTANSSGEAINNNNNYLQNSTTVSLGTDWGNFYRGNNNENIRYRAGITNTSYYLRLNGTTWQFSTTNNNNGALYDVTITPQAAISTNPTINGADVLTATGNSTYTATGAAYRAAYTNYYFRTANHYFDENGNSFTGTPANATLTYAWNLTDNAYATVNNSGVVTVTSLPEYDITLTLTVTATATGGTPAAPANTTLTATKEITIQGTKPTAPIISVSGTTVTLSTDAIGSTTIRYTLDGTDPTASTGTVYSGAIDLSGSSTSPVTIKAVTVRSGNASSVAEQEVTLTLPMPVITADAAAGTATISATAGTTIHYTTDGSEPTTSSSSYSSSISGLSPMTTIKAIAVKDGWNNSAVASETLIIPSGVSGDVVTIFDYEDHNWSYYQASGDLPTGYPTTYLSSPDPRNVKITYQGGSVNNASAVAISALDGEGQNKMIYYKTLEKSVPGMSGDYPYTVISNPFSKRPRTNGTTGTNGFWGFAGWKVISGGEYISEYGDNDVLPLDATIHFVNLPSGNTGNGAVVFEATWTAATVKTGTSAQSFTGGTYETNFWVLTGNATAAVTVPANSTMSARYPDGTVSTSTNFTRQITAGGNNAKVEFVNMNSTQNVDAAGYTFTMGRGIVNSGNGGELRGCSSNKACVHTVKVESGKYASLRNFTSGISSGNSVDQLMILGCDYDRARAVSTASYNEKLNVTGSMYVAGTSLDLQRASGALYVRCIIKSGNFLSSVAIDNNYTGAGGTQTYYFSVGNSNTQNAGRRYLVMEGGIIKGIAGGMDEDNDQNTGARAFDLRVRGTAQIDGVVYGAAEYAGARGIRTMVFTGGTINGWIAGGANGTQESGGALNGTSYLYFGGTARAVCANATANTVMNRAVGGNVFGAGCGNNNNSTAGQVSLGTNVVIADESIIDRGVYGGGSYGYTTSTSKIFILGGTVNGKDGGVNGTSYQSSITGGVFGGACQNQGGTVNIYMDGGLVKGGVFGGSNSTGTLSGSVTMQINGGQVGTSLETANIHGGGYGSATRVSQNVEITLGKSGQTAPGVTVYGDVYGGSALGYVNGTSAADTYHTYVTLNKGIINGSLYGGALGDGSTAANVYGPVQVKVYGGSVRKTDANGANGSGGVYGCNNVNGAPQRAVSVDIYGTDPAPSAEEYALFAVYGGGNAADYTYGNGYPKVTVHNCDNSIEYVYGGGNAAAVSSTDVKIYGGNKIGTVFGGGNGQVTAANVTGNTSVNIYGGTILHVFGGSNTNGTIGGSINVNVNKTGDTDPEGSASACDMIVGEVYGGGNKAASNVGNITIGCTGTLTGDHSDYPENIGVTLEGVGSVYGGANQANISGDITLNINEGIVGNVFGGNNTSGTISGGIAVNIEKNTSPTCNWYVGNVFGGGNLATYTIPGGKALAVNVLNGTVSGNVYGGGKGNLVDGGERGNAGKVTGNPTVNIGDNNGSHTAIVLGDVYGGGDAADVAGTPAIVINDCNTEIGYLYGGGNAADVNGTSITFNAGTVHHDAFGGGHGDKDASNPSKYADVKGNVVFNVYGGTFGRVFAGSNSKGDITGSSALTINKTGTCAMKIGEVYGGGNEAAGKAGSVNIGCTGSWTSGAGNTHDNANLTDNRIGYELEGIGTVYGGANQADIGTALSPSNITLNVNSGMVNRVFGGNNTSGDINGTIAVNINKTSDACSWYVGDVFGGGNLAAYSGSPTVTLTAGTVSGNIYGGGNEAGTGGSTVNINGGAMTAGKGIYGGCNTSGTVTGNIAVNINGGTLGTSGNGNALYGIFGGGYGQSTETEGNVTVTIGSLDGTKTPAIYGDIYGGSALGNVNDDNNDITTVNFYNGTLHGNIFGGGLGDKASLGGGHTDVAAKVYGQVYVNVGAESQTDANCHINLKDASVYGCNNTNGSPQDTVVVHIWKTDHMVTDTAEFVGAEPGTPTYAITNVFGGGKNADYLPENGLASSTKRATVHVHGCSNTIQNVYAGGDAAAATGVGLTIDGGRFDLVFGGGNGTVVAANINDGGTNTVINAGIINKLFGGSNTQGTISGEMRTVINKTGSCTENIKEFFAGGNLAPITADLNTIINCHTVFGDIYGGSNMANITGNVTLTINGGTIDNVYAGSKGVAVGDATYPAGVAADINGDVALNIYSGDIGNAFGGSNINGNITGTIAVTVDWNQSDCAEKQIDNVYGGSNLAVYTPTPALGNGVYSPLVTLTNGQVGRTTTRSVFPAFDQEHMDGHGRVFGAGKGDPNNPAAGGMTARPKVWMNTSGGDEGGVYHNDSRTGFTVLNAIYGGGEVASVTGSTLVQIDHGHVGCEKRDINHDNGFVFGGGKGDTDNPDLANISDSSTVVMKDGYVHNTIFGGGQIASVGTFTRATASDVSSGDYYDIVVGEPISCANGTGITSVRISGGQVGPHSVTMEADLGYVFGAGMGYYTQPDVDYTDPTINGIEAGRQNAKFGYVDSAEVCISDSALIVGAVWGGSENGQVLHNCGVKVKGGQIGLGKEKNNPYSNGLWNRAINAVKTYNADSIKVLSALMPECESWEYSSTYGYLPYDAYIDEDVTNYGVLRDASTANPGDGHTFFGNVFGGGSGYYPYRITVKNYNNTADSVFSYFYRFQGRVRGNTYVDITGGHILTSIYGGCEYADVEGDCHVSMTGGTLGVPRTVDGILSHPVTCYLFGAGKGDQRTSFNMLTNVSNAYVTVGGDAVIFGSVFGGGEDGHVKGNAEVNIKGNAFVGTSGTSYYDGNIFGGGRGFGGTSFNAGTIGGNTTVNISENCKILGNIYGGGRLASVGGHMVTSSDPRYGYLQGNFPGNGVIPEDDHSAVFEGKHGVISVNISGGTIGSPIEFNPYVFSTGRAFDKDNVVKYNNNIYRFTQNHAAGAWNNDHAVLIEHTTGGNVFGGSMGRLFEIDGVTFNHLWPALAKCRSTMVTITDTARIYGNVYGGGELGYVMDSTNVIIDGTAEIGYAIGTMPDIRYTGSIYGGGYGSDNITAHVNDTLSLNGISVTAAMHSGRVYGNTRVTMNNGQVWGNIYGGGEMASVGRRWINMALNGAANNFIPYNGNANSSYTARNWNNSADTTYTTYAWNPHIGNTQVIINGGTVGNNNAEERVIGTHRHVGYVAGETGGVFGGGKGHPGMIGDDFHYTRMAYVDSTNVIIKGGNITGAVFGGGENGHVRFGTLVNMTAGTVGIPLDPIEYETDEYGYSPQPVFMGNLYGGGRGVDHTLHDHLGAAAGQVYGGTKVEISGGQIYHNVYGGGSLASVGRPISIDDSNLLDGTGHAIVTIKGNAVIGDPAAKGLNSGRVFGSGRGVAGQLYAHRAYVRKTTVTIGEDSPTKTCHVYGAVFGSGENGHVQDYTHVYIKDGCMIGELWDNLAHQSDQEFVGNVYGGGRGVDLAGGQISRTAGLVRGSTHITVTGGQIFHNIYGGGSLASVGDTVELSNERRAAGEIYAKYNDTVVYDY